MRFSGNTAAGLSLLAVHAKAIALPQIEALLPGTTVTVSITPVPVTITVTAPFTVTTTVFGLLSAASSNSANTTTTSYTTVSLTSSAISTTIPTTPPTSGLTADQQKALDLHNQYRAAVGNAPLVWDADLAKSAQAWADHLTSVGSLVHDANPDGQGENLALMSGGTTTYYTNAAQMWLNEKSLYDGLPIRTDAQAIWKGTQKVGLALATDAKGTAYVVGRYYPPGNYIGQTPTS
ncbi:pathogenesis-related protein 1A [Colletotrichum spaethianum]|uniref:Pathogenesis-related protein 1A n=1 Tax=Colletotrichum spaethianum TaxID=700344 RepID=A0AA37LD24_9PEZI|nr:pathogenesis-related protein 1A [Colletotrichum spaethianum]GKT46183.1 pathogenesis-related protein 1A [Colletotrichum spaethianum]